MSKRIVCIVWFYYNNCKQSREKQNIQIISLDEILKRCLIKVIMICEVCICKEGRVKFYEYFDWKYFVDCIVLYFYRLLYVILVLYKFYVEYLEL